MINPQLENGHIDINYETAEQFEKTHFSGNEWKILWVVLRKTWGWKKKEDYISLSQFEKRTGMSRPSVKEAIDKLVGKRVLVVNKDKMTNRFSFNKHHNEWQIDATGREKGTSRVFGKKLGTQLVGKTLHTKDITKDREEDITKNPFWERLSKEEKYLVLLGHLRLEGNKLITNYKF